MPGFFRDQQVPWECVTYALLEFECDVGHNGPTRARPRGTWIQVMDRIEHLSWVSGLSWARVGERPRSMVITISEYDATAMKREQC